MALPWRAGRGPARRVLCVAACAVLVAAVGVQAAVKMAPAPEKKLHVSQCAWRYRAAPPARPQEGGPAGEGSSAEAQAVPGVLFETAFAFEGVDVLAAWLTPLEWAPLLWAEAHVEGVDANGEPVGRADDELVFSPFLEPWESPWPVTEQDGEGVRCLLAYNMRYPLSLLVGIIAFRFAPSAAKSKPVFYLTTVSLMTAGAMFIMLFFIVSNVTGNKSGSVIGIVVGSAIGSATSMASWFARTAASLARSYPLEVAAVAGTVALLSFLYLKCKRSAPDDEDSRQVFEWCLRATGLGFIFMGTTSALVSAALLVVAPLTVWSLPGVIHMVTVIVVWVLRWVRFMACCCRGLSPTDPVELSPLFSGGPRRRSQREYEEEMINATAIGHRQLRAAARRDLSRILAHTPNPKVRHRLADFMSSTADDEQFTLEERMNTPIRMGADGRRIDPDDLSSEDDLNVDWSDSDDDRS